MPASSLAHLRWPIAAALLAVAVFAFWPRDTERLGAEASPSPSVMVGQLGGEVLSSGASSSPAATPVPTLTPAATPTVEPTEAQVCHVRIAS